MALPPENTSPEDDKQRKREPSPEDTFMREVDDAMRQDQLDGFLKRYGIPLLVAVAVGLSGLGGYLWWEDRQATAAAERGEQFIVALDELEAGNAKGANDKLALIAAEHGTASAVAARLMRAGIALEEGCDEDAVKIYLEISGDEDAPQAFRDLATVRYVAARMAEMEPQEVVNTLKPLAIPGNAWFGVAGEMVGIAYLEMGKADLAGPLLANIARDEDVAESQRGRARQLAGTLGVDALDDVIGESGEGSGNKQEAAAKTSAAQ